MSISLVQPDAGLPPRPFSSAELDEVPLSRSALRLARAEGWVTSPFRGVFVPSWLPDTVETRAASLALVTPAHQVICDRSAAWLHGVDSYALDELGEVPDVEICARRGHRAARRRRADGRTRDLSDLDIMVVGGLVVTTPLRTALDLGCNLRRREALAAMNAIARRHGITRHDLARELPRFRRRRGVVQLRELVDLVDPRIESSRESWTDLAIHDAGLPRPERQVWIDVDGVPTYRLDFAYRLARVAIEYDGADFHSSDEQRRDDEERRAWLRANGWTVIVLRIGDFTGERLDAWIRQVKEALRPKYVSRRF